MLKSRLRPNLSVSQPNNAAPMTLPARYALADSPMSVGLKRSVGLSCNAPVSEPAMVTSRPSRIQVIPSATTTSQWKQLQGRRSSLAGMSVPTTWPGAGEAASWRVGKDLTFIGRRAPGNALVLTNAELAPPVPRRSEGAATAQGACLRPAFRKTCGLDRASRFSSSTCAAISGTLPRRPVRVAANPR